MGLADAALVAAATNDVAFGRDDVLDVEAVAGGHLAAHTDDFADHLVADGAGGGFLLLEAVEDHALEGGAVPDAAIAAAETGVNDLDQDILTVSIIVQRGGGAIHGQQAPGLVPGHAGFVVDEGLHHRGSQWATSAHRVRPRDARD